MQYIMKASLKIFTALTLAILVLPLFVSAQSPSIPHKFYGTVTFTSEASNGLLVEAKIDDITIGNSITKDGKYGYSPDLLFATDSNSANAGKTVEFYISGIKANETAIFVNGASTNLNLSVEIVESEPTPSPPPTSGGGGGGSTYIPPVLTSELNEAAQAVDANNDDKIDVMDFNTLIVNWGSTAADNLADFDKNNKVDVFDFNLLMIHWVNL